MSGASAHRTVLGPRGWGGARAGSPSSVGGSQEPRVLSPHTVPTLYSGLTSLWKGLFLVLFFWLMGCSLLPPFKWAISGADISLLLIWTLG